MRAMANFLYEISGPSGSSSLSAQLPSTLPIFMDTPFPLEQHVALTESEQGGELLLDLRRMSVAPIRIQALRAGPKENELSVELADATLHGRYEIYGLEQQKNTIDTGGFFSPLADTGSADDTPPPMTPQQYDYLVRADQQRTRLLTTPNGQTLIGNYDDNSDVYTDVFNNNPTLQAYWQEDDATSQMMDWTYGALDPAYQNMLEVNPSPAQKQFGKKNPVTYNYNAFAQQLYLAGACEAMSTQDGDRYDNAAVAAYQFGTDVSGKTGNSQKGLKLMTASQVFDAVRNSNSDSMSEARAAAIRAAVKQLITGEETTQSRQLLADHGYDMTDEFIEKLRAVRQPRAARRRIALWQDYFSAPIARSSLIYRLTEQPNGAITAKLRHSTLRIPSLQLPSANWTGPAAGIAAERVKSAHFLLGMLEDRVRSAVTRHIRRIGKAMGTDAR